MKLKEKLAIQMVEARDFIKDENRRAYGEGYLAGFEKAREMASKIFVHSITQNGRSIYKLISNLGEEEVE